jgi:hypothetical protein
MVCPPLMAMCVSTTLRLLRAAVNVETHTLWGWHVRVGLIRAVRAVLLRRGGSSLQGA